KVIWISLSSIFCNEEVISCLQDIVKPPAMPHIREYRSKWHWIKGMILWLQKRFFLWKCAKRKCDGSCLEELNIFKQHVIHKEIEQYKCPRHGCDGIMHIDPTGIYSNWD
ncbi:MAG: hypothetical protein IKZ31_04325, partial [Lentisphaeria bacterium]|nr:hypothetical protein [Lentisphaeria bacterium]